MTPLETLIQKLQMFHMKRLEFHRRPDGTDVKFWRCTICAEKYPCQTMRIVEEAVLELQPEMFDLFDRSAN